MNYGNMLIAMTFNFGIIMVLCITLSVGEAFRGAAMDKISIKKQLEELDEKHRKNREKNIVNGTDDGDY